MDLHHSYLNQRKQTNKQENKQKITKKKRYRLFRSLMQRVSPADVQERLKFINNCKEIDGGSE